MFSDLSSWQDALINPFEAYENGTWPTSNIAEIFNESIIEQQILKPLEQSVATAESKVSKKQNAWDTLTKVEERLRTYLQSLEQKINSEIFKARAITALEKFEAARNTVLESIYDAVQVDFESHYKMMHGTDEAQFSSSIESVGAELNFEVDFYQRGKFPPQALHSEGHQDSMGLALFFALNSYLIKDAMEIIILDDV